MFQPDEPGGIRNIIRLWIFLFTTFYLMSLCSRAQGSEWKLIDVEKLDLRYSQMDPSTRDPYAPQYTGRWKDRSSLQWRLSVLNSLYWDNDCHVESIDNGTVKTVGWHWEAGIRLSKYFVIFQEHHSRHIMDESPSEIQSEAFQGTSKFPIENSFGIRFRLIEEHTNRGIFR